MEQRRETISIVVPTYNERDNIQPLLVGISKALDGLWDYEVIVVDDNSPDGTARIVHQLAKVDRRIRLLERPDKLGLGSAVVEGFRLAKGDYWVMMDADLSHRPEDLSTLLHALEEADIVVGSRYVLGGSVVNWPLHRRVASRGASSLGRLMVGLNVRDITSGFAAFQRHAVEPILPSLNPKGFKLVFEILAKARGVVVIEAPITFVDRQLGKSKFTTGEIVKYLRLCIEFRRNVTLCTDSVRARLITSRVLKKWFFGKVGGNRHVEAADIHRN